MADSDKVILLKIELDKAQASANIEKLKNSLKKLDGRRREARVIVRKLRLEEAKLSDLRAKSSKSISNHANELKNANKQTGAATSATLEFGRVLSDAPYGIRGVANNLQQLASNLFFMSRGTDAVTGKTIGFLGALGTLGKSLLGPAGILVLFQGLTALLDWYSNRTNEASNSTIDFSNLVDSQAAKLMILKDVLGSTNVSLEDKKKIVSNVNNEFKDLNLTIDEQGKLTKTSQENIDKLTESLVKNAKAQAVLEKITEAQSKVVEIEIERAKRISEGGVGAFEGTLEELEKQRQKYIDRTKNQIDKSNLTETQKKEALDNYMKSSSMQRFDALRDFRKKDLKDANEYVDSLTKMIVGEEMFSIFNKDSGKGKGKGKAPTLVDPKEFQTEAEDLQSEIDSWDKKMLMAATKNKDQILQLELVFYKKSKEARRKDREDAAYSDLFKYEDELDALVKAGKMNEGQAELEIVMARVKTKEKVDSINKEHDRLIEKAEDATEALRLGLGEDGDGKEKFSLEDGLKKYMELQSSMTGFLNGEYDRQLTIEQNKTNALNNELNQRLLNENLSKDERERIQLQIGRNDDKLRKKQEEIERKKFKLNKAANIATASINTYLAATQALSSDTIPTAAKPFVVAATIASGLMQVASIARQKFQSSAGSGGTIGASGGGGGGGEGREFNFNLAGSTQSNQLTQSIASQLNQPIQAYVVSSEITSQQQLDLNISNTATIG